ncbi:MAG: cation transporter [Clostridia bacterium]|nr:cation transporter [Clostridia bacterium]
MELLFKIFIKNKDNISDQSVRNSYGVFSGAVGILLNIVLFVSKLAVGFLTGSVSVAADALNNLSDAGSSIITLIAFKLSGKPADHDHPFGHGRIEYISGLFVAVLILFMGFELIKSSVSKIINPAKIEFSTVSVVILALAVLLKLWMYFFNMRISKKIASKSIQATAKDSLSDALSTTTVLLGILIAKIWGFNIDGYIGLLVSVFILYTGYKAIIDAISPLLGHAPDETLVSEIEKTVMSSEGIIGTHDLIIHNYGPTRFMMSIHAEVPADCDILKTHDEIDLIEKQLCEKFGCDAVIHLDPIETNNEVINETKRIVEDIVLELDKRLSIHDFRMVTGDTHTNVIFDVVIPFDIGLSDNFVIENLKQKISEFNNKYFAVIHIDRT